MHYTVDPITQQVSASTPSGESLVESSTDGMVEYGDDSVSSEEDNDVAIIEVEPGTKAMKDEAGKNEEYACRMLCCHRQIHFTAYPKSHSPPSPIPKCEDLDLQVLNSH